ncbi:hypothetical protein AMS68_006713 [Peltaster fructicola]|uniref:Structural maintenance of chromosomes protein 5 n=1 Tax=Peltaster fructicola TaxID=286661 RepID=A0A6H0Y2M8_9PEZI|nr:hypothetical protein AMS68_006713 [Peltaster fructicola]
MATPRSFDEAIGSDDADSELDNGSSRKRQRLSARSSTTPARWSEQPDNDSDGPVLPDDYRRSPRSGKAVHQPGSIVRVKLLNFVTYTSAEFHPGPNLNMVIGPNGTGKSTLVCAICLGLGWSTANLGRAKDISEFVKHGSQRATIEIELARDPEKHESNPVISTRITKDGSKVEFTINGRKSSKKEVLKLANSFSIQVDNLCQFLPQDRVVEFASLSPVQLLSQTQRAAAPEYMNQWHDELKALGKSAKEKQAEQQALVESLKRLQDRQRAQQADVDRIREHSNLQERLASLQKFKPFPLYTEKIQEFRAAKGQKQEAQRELTRLQRQLEPNLRAANEKERYLNEIKEVVISKQNLVKRVGGQTSTINKQYAKCETDIVAQHTQHENEKKTTKKIHDSINVIKTNIRKIESDMKNSPPVVDFAALNQEIRELQRQILGFDDKESELLDLKRDLKGQIQQREHSIGLKQKEREHMASQVGQQASKLGSVSNDTAKAWNWIQQNKQSFQGEVYGPPMITCTIKNKRCIAAVETVLGKQALLSFTTTNKADFKRINDQLSGVMNLNDVYVREKVKDLSSLQSPCSTEELLSYGLEGWVLDLLEGPEPVLAMLCDNAGIDSAGYTTRALDKRQFEGLKQAPIQTYVAAGELVQTTRRREYGAAGVSSRVSGLKPASFFTETPVNHDRDRQLRSNISELNDEIDTLKQEAQRAQTELDEIQHQRLQLSDAKNAKETAKNEQQRARTAFDALPTKLEAQQSNLVDSQRKIADFSGLEKAYHHEVDRLQVEKAQLALNLANTVEQFRQVHMDLLAAELMELEASSDLQQLQRRHAEEAALLTEREAQVASLISVAAALKEEATALQQTCRTIGQDVSESETEVFDEIKGMTSDQLELEIQSAEARLDLSTGGNRNVIREFEHREKQIASKQTQVEEIKTALETLATDIQNIREQWEPQLQEIIDRISTSFAENFSSINCAGEVGLYKDEDFEQWAIQIKVKFREQEPLSLLDSHRQSGGERAVSTIFYLMALQSLARAPFRVVDEINQGMDPRNERLVHSRLVSIACQSNREDGSGGSQYFLITPKLLSGLEYHPKMKVHCIASGEWMPKNHSSLDFQKLAERALAMRAAPA